MGFTLLVQADVSIVEADAVMRRKRAQRGRSLAKGCVE
jgi:hypothetical protein